MVLEDIYYVFKIVYESSIINNVNVEIKLKQCVIVIILVEREELFIEYM